MLKAVYGEVKSLPQYTSRAVIHSMGKTATAALFKYKNGLKRNSNKTAHLAKESVLAETY